jgi:hypothetical protein
MGKTQKTTKMLLKTQKLAFFRAKCVKPNFGVDPDFVKSILKFPTAATRKKFWEISRLEPDFHKIVYNKEHTHTPHQPRARLYLGGGIVVRFFTHFLVV